MTEHVKGRWADISWLSMNEIEVRFASGVRLDVKAIGEVITERKRMQGEKPAGVLLIVPADTDLDMGIVAIDHLKVHQATDHVVAFAVVAKSSVAEILLRLYKAYYPMPFATEVFTEEQGARTWLGRQVAQALGSQGI